MTPPPATHTPELITGTGQGREKKKKDIITSNKSHNFSFNVFQLIQVSTSSQSHLLPPIYLIIYSSITLTLYVFMYRLIHLFIFPLQQQHRKGVMIEGRLPPHRGIVW